MVNYTKRGARNGVCGHGATASTKCHLAHQECCWWAQGLPEQVHIVYYVLQKSIAETISLIGHISAILVASELKNSAFRLTVRCHCRILQIRLRKLSIQNTATDIAPDNGSQAVRRHTRRYQQKQ
jgi:hypothetical protein